MNIFSFPNLFSGLLIISLGIFTISKNRNSSINRLFFVFTLTSLIWLVSYGISYLSAEKHWVTFWLKVGYSGVIFITIAIYNFSVIFLDLYRREKKKIVFSYIVGFIFLTWLWFTPFFVKIGYRYFWGYYPKASILHPIYLLFVSFLVIRTIYFYYLSLRKQISPSKILKIKYLFTAFGIFLIAGSDFIQNYGIEFYPLGFLFVLLNTIIISYAILKHQLLDIRIVLTRAGLFILVYSLAFGLPFLVGYLFKGWFPPTLLAVLLASPAPFIYNYLRTQTERTFLKEQLRYQTTLKEIAQSLLKEHNLRELLDTAFLRVKEVLEPEFSGMYIFSKEENAYLLRKSHTQGPRLPPQIEPNLFLIIELLQAKKSLLLPQSHPLNLPLETVIIPLFNQEELYGFFIFGPKFKKNPYTHTDLLLFDTLSSQTSLALENCLFWQRERERIAQEEQLRRMQAMDHYSASLAHEIDNPITAIKGQLYLVNKLLQERYKEKLTAEGIKELGDYAEGAIRNLERISKMIKAIRDFSKRDTGEFKWLNLEEVIDFALQIIGPQIKYEGVEFVKEIEPALFLKGNNIYLAEVFINLFSNSLYALKNTPQKKIILKAKREGKDKLLIEFSDNGCGIKKELLEDIFLDFVTTKGSSEGTGMGLARVRKILQMHAGKIWAESQGLQKGTSFYIELPLGREKG